MTVTLANSLLLRHQRGAHISEDLLQEACTTLEIDRNQLTFCLEAARKCEGGPLRALSTPMGGQPGYRMHRRR